MMSWDEEKIRIFMLSNMTQTLKKNAESTQYANLPALVDQYTKIRSSLCAMDQDAVYLLPDARSIHTLSDAKIGIEQLVNYTNAKAMPLLFDLMNSMWRMGMLRPAYMENPLLPLMPILNEWRLSFNWAVGVSALALIEVIVNKKLEEIGLKKDGSFETRFKRLSSKAKEKGIRLPDLLASPFYKARSKVVHEGKEPTPEELEIILKYLTVCSNSLKKI